MVFFSYREKLHVLIIATNILFHALIQLFEITTGCGKIILKNFHESIDVYVIIDVKYSTLKKHCKVFHCQFYLFVSMDYGRYKTICMKNSLAYLEKQHILQFNILCVLISFAI